MAAAAVAPVLSTPSVAQTIAIRHVTVIDTIGSGDIEDATVVIEQGKIASVTKDGPPPAGAEIVDGRGKYLIPGLVDGHVHFFQSGGLYTRPDSIDLRSEKPYSREVADIRGRIDDTLARYVQAGVLGAVDLGGPMWNFDVRDRAAKLPDAPRVFVAGPLMSPYQPSELTTSDPPILLTRNADEAHRQARAQIARKADLLKFWFVLGPNETPKDHIALLDAIVAEGHGAGVKVAVHATELETARAAVDAGADILVHSVNDRDVDQAFVDALKRRGTYYIPTLIVFERYTEAFVGRNPLPPSERLSAQPDIAASLAHTPDAAFSHADGIVAATALQTGYMLRNLKRLSDAGIPIVMGTDAGNIGTLHAVSVPAEMRRMVDAGMSPRAVLAAATINPARMLGIADRVGSVAVGKAADLVLLDRDPRKDIGAVENVSAVIRAGRLVAPSSDAAAVVQRQVEAYNSHDADAFAATYAEDIELYQLGEKAEPFLKGRRNLRDAYAEQFAKHRPNAEILSRRVLGEFVVDQERVRDADGSVTEAAAIYRVRNGLIRQVWFAQPPE